MNNREAFEAWAEKELYALDKREGSDIYRNVITRNAWLGWNASLAAQQQDHIPDVGQMVQSQAQQTESKPVMPVGFLDHGGIFYSYREKIKDGTELYVKSPAPEVCSDGGKCGAGGYCITCPNMPAPEGE